MKEVIRHLVSLQEVAFEIRDLERQCGDGPTRLAALDSEFQERVEEIGGARLRHEVLVEERHRLVEEREELNRRLAVGQQKLMQVNNQREYSAVLNEIDLVKTRLAELEEMIAARNSEIEELSGPAAEADERIAEEQAKLDQQRKKIEDELSRIEERLQILSTKSEAIKLKVPASNLSRFERVALARDGIAVTPIENTACGACHVKLRPQVINLCRRAADIVTCDNCRRILYLREAGNGDAPATAGEGTANAGAPGRPAAGA